MIPMLKETKNEANLQVNNSWKLYNQACHTLDP